MKTTEWILTKIDGITNDRSYSLQVLECIEIWNNLNAIDMNKHTLHFYSKRYFEGILSRNVIAPIICNLNNNE